MKKLFLIVFLGLSSFLISACTQSTIKVAKPIQGEKAIHIILNQDPLLITLDLKNVLSIHGVKASFNSEEVNKELMVKKDNAASVFYKSATDSSYRYQMTFSYAVHPVSNLVTAMVAQVWDSEKKEIIAKYSVSKLDWYLSSEEASQRVYEDFIKKLF
jgi:hypothetical protein